jgi:LPS-assembly lipoprotein
MAARSPAALPARRALLAALGGAALLAGCGFALRQTPPLPFQRIALTGFNARSPLAAELRRRLAVDAQVVDTPGQAEVLLQAIIDKRERSVVASTAAGQVRELQLRVRLEFQLTSPGGRVLIPPTELLLSRDMSYSESVALAKAQEEAELVAAMQADIVQQVLRRLAQVNMAGPAAAASGPRP